MSLETLERERGRLEVQADTRRRELLASKDWVTSRFVAVERVSQAQMAPTTSQLVTTTTTTTSLVAPAAAAAANNPMGAAPQPAPFSPAMQVSVVPPFADSAAPAAMALTTEEDNREGDNREGASDEMTDDGQQRQKVNSSVVQKEDETLLVTPPRLRPSAFPFSTYTPGTPAPELRVAVDLEVSDERDNCSATLVYCLLCCHAHVKIIMHKSKQ